MISNKISELRKKNGMKQIELAKKLGVSQGNLSNWETGNYEPDFATASKIADIFNVSVDYLLGRTDTPNIVIPENLHDPSVQYAFSDNPKDLSQDDWDKVSAFVEFLKSQKK